MLLAGVLTWMFLEWWTRGKPSVLGMITGVVTIPLVLLGPSLLGDITAATGWQAKIPWDETLRVNLTGVFHCTRAALAALEERGHPTLLLLGLEEHRLQQSGDRCGETEPRTALIGTIL